MKSSMRTRFLAPLALAILAAGLGCRAGDSAVASGASQKEPPARAAEADKGAAPPPPEKVAPAATTPSAPGTQAPALPVPAPAPPPPPLTPSGPPQQIVAKVNGQLITRAELDFAVKNIMSNANQQVPAEKQAEFRKSVLDELVDQELLYQKAKASQFSVSDAELAESMAKVKAGFPDPKTFSEQLTKDGLNSSAVEEMIRRRMVITKYVRSTLVDPIKLSPEEEAKFYETNKNQLKHPEQIRASHILRRFKPGASAEDKQTQRAKADEALAKVKKGEDFAELAKQYSEDGSASAGGDLGFFAKGQMVPAFETAAWALKTGETSAVVETQFGFHIIKVTDRRGEGYVPIAEVKDQIDRALTNQRVQGELEKLRGVLRGGAKVEVSL